MVGGVLRIGSSVGVMVGVRGGSGVAVAVGVKFDVGVGDKWISSQALGYC
jgi:hypothetical protein